MIGARAIRWLVVSFLLHACGGGGNKTVLSCEGDGGCSDGVCFEQACSRARTA